jgi:hypothetical protein
MGTASRILIAAALPVTAAIALEVAIYKAALTSPAATWPVATAAVVAGALLLAIGPWKPLTKLWAIALYLPLAIVCFYIVAFAGFCTVGPCV